MKKFFVAIVIASFLAVGVQAATQSQTEGVATQQTQKKHHGCKGKHHKQQQAQTATGQNTQK